MGDDRLDAVAKDIVEHFLGRGFPGKALVVSIDKITTVRTFAKVQRFWAERLYDVGIAPPPLDPRTLTADRFAYALGMSIFSVLGSMIVLIS